MSRIVDQRQVLGHVEREHFIFLMREYEAFCGVQVLTHTVLSNHFHIELEVPRRPEILPTDDELCTRLEALTGLAGSKSCRQILAQLREKGHHAAAEALRDKYFARMWDVSAYMKLLKQRFSQWFNKSVGRKGTLWEGRFKSVLVEGAGMTLATMAAYIDLNSVRANLTEDPAHYRWSGYAEAMAGNERALAGLRAVVAAQRGVAKEAVPMDEVLPAYRMWLFSEGEENEGTDAEGRPVRKGIPREQVLAVLEARGRVSQTSYLRVRVRYFTDGAVLGTRQFVDGVFQAMRSRFGPKRKDGARRMRGLASPELYVLRDLRLRVLE